MTPSWWKWPKMHLDFHWQGFIWITLLCQKKKVEEEEEEKSGQNLRCSRKLLRKPTKKKDKVSNSEKNKNKKNNCSASCIVFKINVEVTHAVRVPRRSRSAQLDASTALPPQACGHVITMRARGAQRLSASKSQMVGRLRLCPGDTKFDRNKT